MAVPSPKRDRLVMVIGKGTVKSISVAAAIPTNDVSQEQSLSPTLVAKSSSNEEPRQDLDEEELNAGINDEVCIFLNIYLYIVFFDFTIIFINLFFLQESEQKNNSTPKRTDSTSDNHHCHDSSTSSAIIEIAAHRPEEDPSIINIKENEEVRMIYIYIAR